MNIHPLPVVLVAALAGCGGEAPAPSAADLNAAAMQAELPGGSAVDTYHGVTVEDPFRWLEDWNDPKVQQWSEQQNTRARETLSAIAQRPAIHARITELLKGGDMVTYTGITRAGDGLLAIKHDPALQQGVLVALGNDADPAAARVVLDPNVLDPSHGTAIDWFVPSHGGELVAVSLSKGGSESGDVHVYRIADAAPQDVVIARVNGGTAGGDLAWFGDDSGFFYTRYPREGERPAGELSFFQQVWSHRLGEPADSDSYVIGREFPRIAATRLRVDATSGRLLVWMQEGDSGRFALHLRQADGTWHQISDLDDGVIEGVFGEDGMLYLVSRAGAPRGRILRLDPATPVLDKAVVLVEEREESLGQSFYAKGRPPLVPTRDRLFALYQQGGPDTLLAFDTEGKPATAPQLLPVSSIEGLTLTSDRRLVLGNESYVSPTQWSAFDIATDNSTPLAITAKSPIDYSDVEVRREFATSKDGTRVPVNILLPKGAALDGTAGIVVTGYGGYGISITPSMSLSRHLLFEHGLLFAEANLRGGGEFGEDWHRAGNLTRKQNVFDDFAAVVDHLVKQGYAAANRVAITGGSNGGLLMGATLTQHPQLAAVVVSHVGIYDMLRVEHDPNGRFNVPEFGTVTDPAQFAALHAYSPYHNVRDGVRYPPLLLPTGANDPRVNPMHSRKFAARLQAAQGDQGVVLLRTSSSTGHGGGTPLDEVIELLADQYAFIFRYLEVTVAGTTER